MVDWVAETPEEFVAIAKSKSQDIAGLAALRMGLRERFLQSTLGSPKRFALEFESALAEAYSVAWASEPHLYPQLRTRQTRTPSGFA